MYSMETTLFLAHLWGPAILAVGIGFFVSRSFYVQIYRNLEKESFAVLVFSMVAIAAGIAQVSIHNSWSTLSEIIVSFLGWSLLLKGVVLAIFPRIADRGAHWTVNAKLLTLIGAIMLAVGAYLTWISYIA